MKFFYIVVTVYCLLNIFLNLVRLPLNNETQKNNEKIMKIYERIENYLDKKEGGK